MTDQATDTRPDEVSRPSQTPQTPQEEKPDTRNPEIRQKKRQRREMEPKMNPTTNTNILSSRRLDIPPPRSADIKKTELRFKISKLKGPPYRVGPVMELLFRLEALHQIISDNPQMWPVAALGQAGLIDYRARISEGPPQVLAAIQATLPARELVLDAVVFAEGFLFLDNYIQTITDPELKEAVESLVNELRPPPQSLLDTLTNTSFFL